MLKAINYKSKKDTHITGHIDFTVFVKFVRKILTRKELLNQAFYVMPNFCMINVETVIKYSLFTNIFSVYLWCHIISKLKCPSTTNLNPILCSQCRQCSQYRQCSLCSPWRSSSTITLPSLSKPLIRWQSQ